MKKMQNNKKICFAATKMLHMIPVADTKMFDRDFPAKMWKNMK